MNVDINKLIRNVSQVKLQGGLFAKASIVIIVVSICLFGIAAIASNLWVSIGAIVLIFLLAFIIMWRLINFANRNPQAAILEGAQLLVHEQMQLAAKGIKEIPDTLNNLTEDTNVTIDDKSKELANKSDEQIEKEGKNE